jgi:hypothetical protein
MVADIKEHTKMLQFIVSSIDVLIIGNALLELARTSVKKKSIYDMLQMLEVDNPYNTATCYLRRPVQFITSALHADGS